MKKRDLVYLLLAVTIFLVAGYLAYTMLMPKTTGQNNNSVMVEQVGDVPESLQGDGLNYLEDGTKTLDFNSQTDLSGLGNKAPFGQ